MAMGKVCANLPRLDSSSCSRPASLSALLSRDKQLRDTSQAAPHFPIGASRASAFRFVSISSSRLSMEKGAQVLDFSDQANTFKEDLGFGGGGADGNGSGGGGGDGDGGDEDSFKGDDAPSNSPFSWYLLLLNNHPVTTKAITAALISLFGDLVCQLLIEKSKTIDLKRIGIFSLLGLVLVGPTLHFWYLNLSKLIPGPGALRAGSRLVLDQFLFSPVFIAVFLSAMLTLEGHSNEIAPKLKQDFLSVVVANWKIWIPFQFLNFLFVPQQLQVLAANVISLVWNTYLSFAAHKNVMPPAQKDSFTS